jgi:hypothetical protein
MTRPPLSDEPDDHDDAGESDAIGDREIVGEDSGAVAFEIIDMVALLGANYALGYEILDGEYSDVLQAHRYLGTGKGFERVTDAGLIDRLVAVSVLSDDDDDDDDSPEVEPPEPPEALTYAIVDTVAVDQTTWTLGRPIDAVDGSEPDVYRYEGHGKSFSLANYITPALRARIEDEVRGFEQDDVTYERIDFDLRRIVEHDEQLYAVGYRYDDEAEEPAPRVWRHLGDGLGFELVDLASPLHAAVTRKFPGLFDDDDRP